MSFAASRAKYVRMPSALGQTGADLDGKIL
jgi:hypothetical protein